MYDRNLLDIAIPLGIRCAALSFCIWWNEGWLVNVIKQFHIKTLSEFLHLISFLNRVFK